MKLQTYLWRCKRENGILLFWLLLNSICVLLHGFFSSQALTALVALNLQKFLFFCLAIVGVNLLWTLQIHQGAVAKEKAIQRMDEEIRLDITANLEKASYQEFHQEEVSSYVSWLTNDIHSINDLGFETLEYMVMQGLNILFGIGMLALYHFSFLPTLLIFFLLMTYLPRCFSRQMEEKALAFSEKNEDLVRTIQDVLAGFDVLFGANQQRKMSEKIRLGSRNYAAAKISYADSFGKMMASQNGLSFISQIAILSQAGFLFYLGLIPIGAVSTSQYFASIVFAGLTGFFANLAEVQSSQPIFDKYPSYTDQEGVELDFAENLRLENVSLKVAGSTILSNFSQIFEKNKHYLILGKSGVGKTSLLKVIAGYMPDYEGSVRLDLQEIREAASHQRNSLIAYVPQEPYLFQETLLYNLTLGNPVSKEDLQLVAEKFFLEEILEKQAEGWETVFMEKGKGLSGGEKQRLALARAYLSQKPILLIDEGLSAIDTKRAREIERFLLADREKTLIFVSHHVDEENLPIFDEVVRLG